MKIKSLELKNYRCFKETAINFSDITILTGANSSGKSTIISAILLYLQSNNFPFYLNLNGKYINLGDFSNIAHSEKESINFKFETLAEAAHEQRMDIDVSWEKEKDKSGNFAKLSNLALNLGDKVEYIKIRQEKGIFYLSLKIYTTHANRKDVEKFYANSKYFKKAKDFLMTNNSLHVLECPFKTLDELLKNGIYEKDIEEKMGDNFPFPVGNIATWVYLNDMKRTNIDSNFNYIGSFRLEPQRTYYQKNAPESKIDSAGNGYIDTIIKWEQDKSEKLLSLKEILKELDLFYDLKVNYMQGGRVELKVKTSKSGKLVNISDVGFGISQFLPIIVADLQLSDDSLLAISQPEIHLHPSIQAKFSDYIALQVKKKRKQYIIETHSEYILNRLRLLIAKKELKEENVSTYYFENSGKESKTFKIDFSKDGKILNAPKGFFETYMLDVMDIALNA
ncbi:MAG: DUF3696 domain-containing protein [Leptospiraceae bacterium]|nr:DUF3696 domain-containing protein [Leptospiraceae bacterium]